MIQPIRRQARMPLVALLVVALAALVSISLARVTTGSAARVDVAAPTITVLTERPSVQAPAEKPGCDAGTYVSGDLAGDTSPMQIYATMCPAAN